jgi:hypothetical protein
MVLIKPLSFLDACRDNNNNPIAINDFTVFSADIKN